MIDYIKRIDLNLKLIDYGIIKVLIIKMQKILKRHMKITSEISIGSNYIAGIIILN
jgi:hypothetical protein